MKEKAKVEKRKPDKIFVPLMEREHKKGFKYHSGKNVKDNCQKVALENNQIRSKNI